MLPRLTSGWLRSASFSAAILLAASGSLAASSGDARPGTSDLLKPLPAGRTNLVFRGENSAAAFPVFLSRAEAARASVFQLGLLNTVSLLPERSSLRLSINGRTLANLPIRSAEKTTAIPVRIPPGVLVPGFNDVQVSVTMSHRVDCSIKATYELWTLLDSAKTGLLVPTDAAAAAHTLDDLAAEPPAEDGTTRIHVRIGADADADALSRAASLVTGLVVRSHLSRPLVDLGPEPGTGPGFDVALDGTNVGAGSDARIVGRQDGIVLARSPANRLTVAPEGTGSDVDQVIADLGASGSHGSVLGTAAGVRTFRNASGAAIADAGRLTFADLGGKTDSFPGRRYVATLGVTLPPDFYAGSYGKAQIYLDGSREAGLTRDAALIFRVNGTLVSTLPLGPGSPDHFDHALVDLPLQFFRPGYNEIELEGLTPTAGDAQCDVAPASSGTRLTIADTSELVIPHLARLATAPQIAPALRFDASAGRPTAEFYVVRADEPSLAVALTTAANMAARDGVAGAVHINLDEPSSVDKPGIVVGALADLPASFTTPLKAVVKTTEDDASAVEAGAAMEPTQAAASEPQATHGDEAGLRFGDRARGIMTLGEEWLRRKGFFFTGLRGGHEPLAVGEHALVVADIAGQEHATSVAGFELPRIARSADDWLVVSGQSTSGMAGAIRSLVAEGRWKALGGEAAVYDPDSAKLETREAATFTYVLPDTIALGDLRPVLGGVISGNILASAACLLLLLTLLGVTTQLVLRLFGERVR